MTNHRPAPLYRLLVLLTGVLAISVAASGCAHPSKNAGGSTDQANTGQLNAREGASEQTGGAPAEKPTGRPSSAPAKPTSTTSTASGPQIVSFSIVGNANCGGSGPGYSSPGTVTLHWKVTGANSVALSIDNPDIVGGYQSGYGLEATETLPFGCGGQIGQKVTHKYTIVAVYPGANRARTLDVSATYYG
jgi:hypothetical protein